MCDEAHVYFHESSIFPAYTTSILKILSQTDKMGVK